jgi:hypothetical protein
MTDFYVLAGIIVAVIALEIIALASWNRWYFTRGIKVLKLSGSFHNDFSQTLLKFLQDNLNSDADSPDILNKKIDDGVFLLREEMLHFRKRHSGIIRVHLTVDSSNRQFMLIGILNLSSFLPLFLFIYFILNARDLMQAGIFILFSIMIMAVTWYGFRQEAMKYRQLAEQLSQQNST